MDLLKAQHLECDYLLTFMLAKLKTDMAFICNLVFRNFHVSLTFKNTARSEYWELHSDLHTKKCQYKLYEKIDLTYHNKLNSNIHFHSLYET